MDNEYYTYNVTECATLNLATMYTAMPRNTRALKTVGSAHFLIVLNTATFPTVMRKRRALSLLPMHRVDNIS